MSVSGDDEDDDDRFVEPFSSLSRTLPLSVCIFACPNSTFRHLEAKLREHTVSLKTTQRMAQKQRKQYVSKKIGCVIISDTVRRHRLYSRTP